MSAIVVRVVRIVLVMLLLGIGSLLSTGTAMAGGPTSALLVSPGGEVATGLYYSDQEYGMLQELLAEPPTGATSAATGVSETASDYITVTWLIHDVTVWRIDRVFLPAKGEPLIVTQDVWDTSGDATGMFPGQNGNASARHHRSPDPAALTSLLEELGLINPGPSSPVAEFVPAAADSAGPASDNPAPAAAWWLLGGLVGGIAVCTLTVRYVPAVRRQVLARAPATEPDRPGDEPVRMDKLPV